jgi:glycosyltransferase involved in cell wall biosynthesis
MPRANIAFVSSYDHPSRDSFERTVREAFPEYGLDSVTVANVLKAHRGWRLPNLYHVAAEYGARILRRDATLRDSYFRTSYLFRKVHGAMTSVIDPARHVFSFQTQSVYDASVPGVPHFVYTDHTHLSNLEARFFDPRKLRPQRWLALERSIYRNAARVFTRSHNIAADLVELYRIPAEKVVCVYAGANVSESSRLPRGNDGYAKRNILFVGADWERKGGPVLAAAFERVLRVLPDAHLTIAGARPLLDLPNCTILGNVPINKLSAHYARATVFCLPTRLEPFGISVLEAMMHRLPVVATAIGAIPDMVRDGISGHMVPPGDAEALAAALIDLLRDPRRCRQFGHAGYVFANDRYTWPAVGARMRAEVVRTIASMEDAGAFRREPTAAAVGLTGPTLGEEAA